MGVININDKTIKNVNVEFSRITEYEDIKSDIRFTKCKIYLMHTGRNYNGSYFSKEVVEENISSLSNIPILGFVENNKEGEEDFSDHRVDIVKTKDGYEMKYMGTAYGVIPSENNHRWELHIDENGIEREYLVVEGILWNKLGAVDILNKFEGRRNHSMELADEYEAHWDEKENAFVFDKFMFEGACIINCSPAMSSSHITIDMNSDFSKTKTLNFSASEIAKEIEDKLKKFELLFNSTIEEKEVENLSKEVEVILENEKVDEAIKEKEEIVEEDKETKDEESKSENLDDEKKNKDDKQENFECKKKYSINFELAFEDILNKLYEKLWEVMNIEDTYCYIMPNTTSNSFIYCDCNNGQLYKQEYKIENEEVLFVGERVKVYQVIVDEVTKNEIEAKSYSAIKSELEETNAKLENYANENKELVEFKNKIEESNRLEEIENVIAKFSCIEGLDINSYKKMAINKEFSVSELEEKLCAELGKLQLSNFSKKEVENKNLQVNFTTKIQDTNSEVCPYGELSSLFE